MTQRSIFLRPAALLLICTSLEPGWGLAASRLNPEQRRILELSPAVVFVSVHYGVMGTYHVGDEEVNFGPTELAAIRAQLQFSVLNSIVIPASRQRRQPLVGATIEMLYTANLKVSYSGPTVRVIPANNAEYEARIERYGDPSGGKDVSILKIDAAISPRLSGSPAFNDANEAIGMASFRSTEEGASFFVPIDTAMSYVNETGVKPESGLFNQLWTAALGSYDAGRCQDSKRRFGSVLNILPNFPMPSGSPLSRNNALWTKV